MYCGKCGSEIKEGYSFCMKCGTKASAEDGEKISVDIVEPKVKKKSQKIIPVIAVLIIALIGIGAFCYIKYIKHDSGYYGDTKWGMTVSEVQELYPDAKSNEEGNILLNVANNYDDIEGFSTIETYTFVRDKLTEVSILSTIGEDDPFSTEDIINHFEEKYDKMYEQSSTNKWNTEKTKIEMKVLMDIILIKYEDINMAQD